VERLYLDPCVQPLSTSADQAGAVVQTVQRAMQEFPGIHTTAGLSNISFGLPYRGILNRTFLTMLVKAGLDSAILDPTERDMMATVYAAEALSGRDEFCMNYISAARRGLLRPTEPE
jgi:5-methyltetrahydrofolate--homocysteine methyltransferase